METHLNKLNDPHSQASEFAQQKILCRTAVTPLRPHNNLSGPESNAKESESVVLVPGVKTSRSGASFIPCGPTL